MKKKLAGIALILTLCLGFVACNGAEVSAIIGDIAQSVVSVLGIEGLLSAATQTQINTLATTAEGDYTSVLNAPAAEKATALLKFQTSWGAFLNLVNPILQDAHANPILTSVVDIALAQVTTITNIVAAAQPADLSATAATAHLRSSRGVALKVDATPKSEADYRKAFNAAVERFGSRYKINGPVHQDVNHAAAKLKFWRW